jgi:hypothetical protein
MRAKPAVAKKLPIDSCQTSRLALYLSDVECDSGYSVAQTSDGGYIVAGFTRSFDAGGADVYLIKVDANGDL